MVGEESKPHRLHNTYVKMRVPGEKLEREAALLREYHQLREKDLLGLGFEKEEIDQEHLNIEWDTEEGWFSFMIFQVNPELFTFLLLSDIELRPIQKEYIEMLGKSQSRGLATLLKRLAK